MLVQSPWQWAWRQGMAQHNALQQVMLQEAQAQERKAPLGNGLQGQECTYLRSGTVLLEVGRHCCQSQARWSAVPLTHESQFQGHTSGHLQHLACATFMTQQLTVWVWQHCLILLFRWQIAI